MGTTLTGGADKPGWQPGMNDRRDAQRRNVVDSHVVTVDLGFQSGALLLDLSETGMGVQALASAPAGNTTSLHFDLPETGGRVEAVGRIEWTDSSGRMGIRFQQIAEVCRLHLSQWLSSERRPSPGQNAALPGWPPAHMRDEIAALRRDLVTQKLEGDAALALVVERACSITRATGAAIALEEDGNIVCRASSGNAPGVGAHLDPNSGLSGECVRTGEVVRCEDTETDPRADRLVCRKLDLRSIIIVPIRIQGHFAGVLEAFSSRVHAFQNNDVLLLRRVSDLIAGVAARQPNAGMEAPSGRLAALAATQLEPPVDEPEASPEAIAEAEPLMMAEAARAEDEPLMMDDILALGIFRDFVPPPVPLHEIVLPPDTSPEAEGDDSEAGSSAVTWPAESDVEERTEAAETPTVRVVGPEPAVEEPTAKPADGETKPEASEWTPRMEPAPLFSPGKAEAWRARAAASTSKLEETAPAIPNFEAAIPATRSFVAAAPAREEASVSRIRAATAAAAAPATMRRSPVAAENEEFATPIMQEFGRSGLRGMAAGRLSSWNMRIMGGAILAAVLLIGGWQAWRMVSPPKGTPMDSEVKGSQPAAKLAEATGASATATTPAAAPALVPVSTTPAPPKPTATPPKATATTSSTATAPSTAPADVTKRLANGNKTAPAQPAAAETPKIEDAPPPTFGLVSRPAEGTYIASVLSAPVAKPSLDKPVVSKVTGGKLLHRVEPNYPLSAMGVLGEVTLKAIVGKDGKVKSVKVLSGHAVLAQAAAVAVKNWRYEPFVLNGVPIEVENTVVVNFKPRLH